MIFETRKHVIDFVDNRIFYMNIQIVLKIFYYKLIKEDNEEDISKWQDIDISIVEGQR
jgi:hypothetical protein